MIIDKSQNIEKEVIDKIMYSKLREALKALDGDELKIIKSIFLVIRVKDNYQKIWYISKNN